MRYILLVLGLTLSLISSEYTTQLNKLTKEQQEVLKYTIAQGKQNNLGYLLAAIAWKESNLGLWQTNLSDGKYGSYGIYHNLLEYYINNQKKSNNSWNRSRLAEQLLFDRTEATRYTVELLTYWMSYYKTDYLDHRVIKSYNGGYKIASKQVINYYNDITKRIDALTKKYGSLQELAVK